MRDELVSRYIGFLKAEANFRSLTLEIEYDDFAKLFSVLEVVDGTRSFSQSWSRRANPTHGSRLYLMHGDRGII